MSMGKKTKDLTNRQKAQLRSAPKPWEVKKPQYDELRDQMLSRAQTALEHLDDEVLLGANPAELVKIVTQFIEYARLLDNLPTQIVASEQRLAMAELAPRLLAEMKRRGITLDLPQEDYQEISSG